MRLWYILFLSCSALLVVACQPGSGEGLSDNGRPLNEATNSVALNATLESLQANLFTPNCAVSGCHTSSTAPLGLALDDGLSYSNLVSKSSVQQPDKLRVKQGDATNSYLVQKIEGSAGISGNRMPRDRARLEQSLIDALKQWIDNGAPVSSASTVFPAPVVSSSSILNNTSINSLPASMVLQFSQAMDPQTLVDLTINLLSAGGDSSFSENNETALIVQPNLSVDGLTLTLDLSANAAVGNTTLIEAYQLTIKGSGAAVARALNTQVLDGDSDGRSGGDYILKFSIVAGLLPTFNSLETNLFVPNCAKSGCHSGGAPAAGMNLDQGNVYASIVDVQSTFMPLLKRIQRGNADASAIVQALEGTASGIPQMPFDNPGGIAQGDINILRQWINDGANP